MTFSTLASPGVSLQGGGGSGGPGGSDTQVQFNDGGAFGGDSGLTFNKTTDTLTIASAGQLAFSTDLLLTRRGAANLRLGAADAAAPVPQTLSVQSVVAGTNNTAGANLTITGSQGTGTGAGGSIIFQVAPAGSSGSAQNALETALTIDSSKNLVLAGQIQGPNADFVFRNISTNNIDFYQNNSLVFRMSYYNFKLAGDYSLSWTSSSVNAGAASDLTLARDAANTLAQRNGNNGQIFRLYGRFTDITNDFERFFINAPTTSGAAVQLGTQKGATAGTARALELQTDGTSRWTINTSGHLLAAADNTYDIGASGATRPRNIYTGGFVILGGYIQPSYVRLAAGANEARIYQAGNGVITFYNAAETSFDRLQFGGTTSSFPALKRSSASIIVRLADDTANAALESASVKTDAPAGGTSGTWKLGVAATVSPTSPNRTIEVDIGGTIYYLHAKTTND